MSDKKATNTKRRNTSKSLVPSKKLKIVDEAGGPSTTTTTADDKGDDVSEGILDCDKDEGQTKFTLDFPSPAFGQSVDRRSFRRAGPYILGPKIGQSPVESMVKYLAKKENSDEFVQLKILMLSDETTPTSTKDLVLERQGKMLLHTEFSLLSLLENQEGVIHHHGMFSDMAYEEVRESTAYYTGKVRKRLILVLDCVSAHDFNKKSTAFLNLQQYLGKKQKLPEIEALGIFYEIILVVESLHKKNIIHRDLKLGNIILNKISKKIIIKNFCLGKYLLNENDLLYDQRGSPAYISPDVLCGAPYKGKPSDMWALGVVLFMMFYGKFPFFEATPTALFKKIKLAEYTVPLNTDISSESQNLIKGLLQLRADWRMTATQVRERIEMIFTSNPTINKYDQIVPTLLEECVVPKLKIVRKHLNHPPIGEQLVPVFHAKESSRSRKHSKNQSTAGATLNGNFLRPSNRVSLQQVGRDARQLLQNEIGHFQLLIQNTGNSGSASPAVSVGSGGGNERSSSGGNHNTTNRRSSGGSSINISSNSNNWQATIRFRNNGNNSYHVTQQMSNLSLRHRRELGLRALSWHDVRSTAAQHSNSSDTPAPTANNSLTEQMPDYSRYLTRLFRCAIVRSNSLQSVSAATLARRISTDLSHSAASESTQRTVPRATMPSVLSSHRRQQNHLAAPQMVPNSLTLPRRTLASARSTASLSHEATSQSLQQLFNRFNELFSRGQLPVSATSSNLINFNGIITPDIADRICRWLENDYRDFPIIQTFFINSSVSPLPKLRTFLIRCGVRMHHSDNRIINVKPDQPLDLLLIMTFILQASGYNNSYFITS